MSNQLEPPPLYDQMIDESGKAKWSWSMFFQKLYQGDSGTNWTPTFTNLTTVGSPVISGTYYRLTRSLTYFSINITPATSTTSVAGTTYCNYPLKLNNNGICFAVTGLLGSGSGMCDKASNNIYVPAWSAVTVPITIIGFVEAY